jgi:hypothetical protein
MAYAGVGSSKRFTEFHAPTSGAFFPRGLASVPPRCFPPTQFLPGPAALMSLIRRLGPESNTQEYPPKLDSLASSSILKTSNRVKESGDAAFALAAMLIEAGFRQAKMPRSTHPKRAAISLTNRQSGKLPATQVQR